MKNSEAVILVLSTALLLIAQVIYIRNTWTKKTHPNILSWIGWSLLMATSMISQILEEGWDIRHLGVCLSSLGCAMVVLVASARKNFVLEKSDWWFLFMGAVCVVLYLVTKDPLLTTIFAISADFVLGLPTLIKAHRYPEKERSLCLGNWNN